MTEALDILWYVLVLVPAIFWFFLIRNFNRKYKSKFPAILYSVIYLVPLIGHAAISWSFVNDLKEAQVTKKIPALKTYLLYLALPDLFLLCGLQLFILVGVILTVIGIPLIGVLAFLASFVPYVSFIWLAWGFWKLNKMISASN